MDNFYKTYEVNTNFENCKYNVNYYYDNKTNYKFDLDTWNIYSNEELNKEIFNRVRAINNSVRKKLRDLSFPTIIVYKVIYEAYKQLGYLEIDAINKYKEICLKQGFKPTNPWVSQKDNEIISYITISTIVQDNNVMEIIDAKLYNTL